jgi:hypothetical protein
MQGSRKEAALEICLFLALLEGKETQGRNTESAGSGTVQL